MICGGQIKKILLGQRDGLIYMDVDDQPNLNLLNEALNSGEKKVHLRFLFKW